VRDSWTRALDPATAGGNRDNLAAITYLRDIAGAGDVLSGASTRLAGVQVTGDRTLSIALSDPSPAFLMKLASVPASIVDTSASIPNGSGPYAVEAWDPAASLTLRASPTWWAGEPATTSIQIRLGISASQPLNLYQAGEIDLVRNVQPELVDLVEDPASGISYGDLMVSNKFAVSYIALGNTEPPLDDVHVRRALRMVFPSALVAKSTYRGEAIPATGLLPPGMLGESWDVPPEVSGTGAARAELAKSRYGDAAALPPIPIHAADPTAVEALRDVAAAELGLTVQAIAVAWPDFVPGLAKHRFPAYALYWEADYPDPESMIDMLFASDSADNYTGYTNPELDALLLEAHVSDRAGRVAAYHLANQLLVEDGAVIPLCHWRAHTLVRKGIAGVTPTAMGIRGLESIHAAG
jgi:oligopeptide transport system substrate-binding protein